LDLTLVQQLENPDEVGIVRLGDAVRKRLDGNHLARTRDRCLQRTRIRTIPVESHRELLTTDTLGIGGQHGDQFGEPQAQCRLAVTAP